MTDESIAHGLKRYEENMLKSHSIPLLTLVELGVDSSGSYITDGLRLYVQRHHRDCDGTPLYALTHDYTTVGRNLHHRDAVTEDDRHFAKLHRGAATSGHPERALRVIKAAEDVAKGLEDTCHGFDGKQVYHLRNR